MKMEIITQIILLILGSGGFITYVIKSYADSRSKKAASDSIIKERRADTINEIDKEKMLAEIKDDDQFKRLIIDKIIDKYVDQTDRIFQMFEEEFKDLVSNIQSLNKTIEKSYAQTEALRSQTKEFYEEYTNKLHKTEGLILGLVGIFNNIQDKENLIQLANRIKEFQEIKTKLDSDTIMLKEKNKK